ncbi:MULTISPECIES: hypothetical protein [Micrococcaceae]|uniref:hypothetical protein n=1 Tax=Micrococcaceae TaxID=1268 RepID=UPI00063DA05B|nr:hypothetical protein [Arthrobacter sp. YC-RL1]ALQ30099.1 hypothetical protein ATC04_05695 [Arthrobacter sp. YC-RL1]KLI88576.1 hypothetical protein AA310_12350 [Arthrobacter sp. YC-RL1]
MKLEQDHLTELAELRFEKQQLGYHLAEIRTKLRGNNHHRGLIAARVRKLNRLKEVDTRLEELKTLIARKPFSQIDLVVLIERLAELEATIVDQGYEGGLRALRAFIKVVIADQNRLSSLEGASE